MRPPSNLDGRVEALASRGPEPSHRRPRRLVALLVGTVMTIVLVVGAVLVAGSYRDASPAAASPAPVRPASAATTTAAKAPAPVAAPNPAVTWTDFAGPDGTTLHAAIFTPTTTPIVATVVLIPGTGGFLSNDPLHTATMLALKGLRVVEACTSQGYPASPNELCPNAPPASGVSDTALRSLDMIVDATRALPGVDPNRIAMMGYSRGGGLVGLRAARESAPEPYVSVYGVLSGPISPIAGEFGPEVYATNYARGLVAPGLLLTGSADGLVTPSQSFDFAAAAEHAGSHAPDVHLYAGLNHFMFPDSVLDEVGNWILAAFPSA